MKKPDTTIIDQDWPLDELEEVNNCPYCGSVERTIAYENVQDWSFYCAHGKWTYWDCANCEAVYLSPRPIEKSIYKAYSNYYTHNHSKLNIKTILKNECLSLWLNINIQPRLRIPRFLSIFFEPLKNFVNIPFELKELVTLPKGKILDIGCGDGAFLNFAKQLGWEATGIEIDSDAVIAALNHGVNVLEGDFRELNRYNNNFDCVICSHVLEHVYEPLTFLNMVKNSLKVGGVLMISLPNANSFVRSIFADSWRGIEAPRHIAIPTNLWVSNHLKLNYEIHQVSNNVGATILASKKIAKLRKVLKGNIEKNNSHKVVNKLRDNLNTDDYTQLICYKL